MMKTYSLYLRMWIKKTLNLLPEKPQSKSKGISDFIGQLTDGVFFAVEVKSQKHVTFSEEQADFLNTVLVNNGLAMAINDASRVSKIIVEYFQTKGITPNE
jgi:hypothetical protein